jgi:TrmH family RNA methyltransferase
MKNIISRDNPTYKQLKKLTESARERRKAGRTLLDGVHLIESYFAAGHVPDLLVVSESGLGHPECAGLLKKVPTSNIAVLPDLLFSEISPVETPVGLMAVVALPPSAPAGQPSFCVMLEDIQDPGNLGAILRSAAAAGVEAAYLTLGCADAWSPKALRAGMGAHFVMHIEERVPGTETVAAYAGITVATSLDAQESLYDLDLTGNVMILVGNEGAGLSPELQHAASHRVTIPMPGKVESLNAAAAAAVCFFERVRQISH